MFPLMVHIPVMFFLRWLFARYLPYLPPIKITGAGQNRMPRHEKLAGKSGK
jgi:hypothetical protein